MKNRHSKYFETIGANVRDLRKKRGWTQQELANRCNIDRAKISRIENASEDFMLSTLIEIALALEVELKDII